MCGVRQILFVASLLLTASTWPDWADAQIQALPLNTAFDEGLLGDARAGGAWPDGAPASPQTPVLLYAPPLNVQCDTLDGAPPIGMDGPWQWRILPDGLLYRNYLAGTQEPRLGTVFFYEPERDWLWDAALGAHVGILRYGSSDPILGEGLQLDAEGAAFVRLDLEERRDVDSSDFHFGFPVTCRLGIWEAKLGYHHVSSHLGDEWSVKYPDWERLNYVRDSLVLGLAIRPVPDLRFYAEADWAVFFRDGGAGQWHFQFGMEYSPVRVTGWTADPFFAVNSRLREEADFGGNLTVQTGWQWRDRSGRLLRAGFHYFIGKSNQYQFFQRHEEQYGFGIWYDY